MTYYMNANDIESWNAAKVYGLTKSERAAKVAAHFPPTKQKEVDVDDR